MTPWKYAKPLAVTLFSWVVATYLLFSPIGAARSDGPGMAFALAIAGLVMGNAVMWARALRRPRLSHQ